MKKVILYFLMILLSLNLVLAAKLTSITLNNEVQVFKVAANDGLSITGYNRSAIIIDNVGSVSADLKIFGYDGSIIMYYTLSKDNIIKVDFNKDKIYDAEIGFVRKETDKSILAIKGINEINTFNTYDPSNSNSTSSTTNTNEDSTGNVIADVTGQTTFKTNTTKGIFIALISIVCVLSLYYVFKKE